MSEVAASTEVETKVPAVDAPVVEGEVKTEEKKPDARNYSQDEVDRILAKVRKNERYRTKKEVEAFYAGRDSAVPKQEQAKTDADKEPLRADFDSYEEFLEARTDHRARKAAREETSKATNETKQQQVSESRQKVAQEFQKQMRTKFPNIDDLIEEVGDAPVYSGVQEAIMESPLGPEIFNELLTNPKEFERLAALSEAAAIREIGKLEARLEAKAPKAETKETKPASKAPAPVTPPGGATASTSEGPSDKDDINTWMTKERARLAKQRK